ncbi:DNA-methyltransferase [Methylomonas rosea]|uniref:Methyltransferase n=1 Tax=Methylomonas rosea TaxID=2952227 RepID=A0ABT1TQZ8_9GAMM|nr:site-specific DNA-methyltransferase [Methylomonas sp. WSC-7]MCQ8117193.1 site-specific DNA-methyltransferase [Methylomonas sp. WSC-7]
MTEIRSEVRLGDCLEQMKNIASESVDLIYLDPPFFTNRHHTAINRERTQIFSFSDAWNGLTEYAEFMELRLRQIHRILKNTGSVFVHCDKSANFLLRVLLDKVFGSEQFRSEIIWTYRRWSNSAKGLMPAHQTIFFYSKTTQFKFNRIYCPYSETTNIDQILQLRARDQHGVSTYATDQNGEVIYSGNKKGVPLSDVWEIPFLNPKAKERTGYPTQKPVLLLERVIEIASTPGDLVLDPFCGSGTTLVAAKLLGRSSIGIDCAPEAVELTQCRLTEPDKTESNLLKKGRAAYINANNDLLSMLNGLDFIPVQRNAGIDAFINTTVDTPPIPVRIQRQKESIADAANKLANAAKSKNAILAILVRTHLDNNTLFDDEIPPLIKLVEATALQINQTLTIQITDIVSKRVPDNMAIKRTLA